MKALVLGRGQVGSALLAETWPHGFAVECLDRAQLDVTDGNAVADALAESRADLVINAAAYTSVDQAERQPDTAFAVNRDGARHVAKACAKVGAALIHLSTDYVFDGEARTPYTEDASVRPLSTYGRSKSAGEAEIRAALDRHLILRTSWIYGRHGSNFVKTILELAESSEIRAVADQYRAPTSARDLSRAIIAIAPRLTTGPAAWGTYHFTGGGQTTWHGLAATVLAMAAPYGTRQPRLVATSTAEYQALARRPAYSVLDCTRIARVFGLTQRPWKESLGEMIAEHFHTGCAPAV
jgi:dTDP-4-dehydrorhamnose reductase